MSWLHALRERLLGALRPAARDRELAEEIEHHLAMEAARQRWRGHDPAAARARALERFGDPEAVKRAVRAERGRAAPAGEHSTIEGTMHDVRWAARALRKQAGFTVLALATLALGIGVTTVAFTVLDTVLLRPLPYADADRLVMVRERGAEGQLLSPSYPNFDDWRARARSFAGVASSTWRPSATVWLGGEAIRVPALGVSRDFFRVLGAAPVVGREFTADENRAGAGAGVAMVSYEFWKTRLNGARPLPSLRLGSAGDETAAVVGVLPPGVRPGDGAELYLPHERGPGTVRNAHAYTVVARLAPGATVASARAEMSALSRALKAQWGDETQAVDADVTPLRDVLVGDYRRLLAVVLAAAGLVLLIACTNLVSALLARGLVRGRELAVRAAIGASRARLARQLLVETGLLVLGGASGGTLLALGLTRLVRRLGAGLVPRLDELAVRGSVLAFVGAVAVATVVVVGLYPALRLAARDAGRALGGGTRGVGAAVRGPVWRLLVGLEVAMAVVLLVGSTLLVRTLHNILSADTGFDPRGVVTATLVPGDAPPARLERLRAELAALPGVSGAALTSRLPLAWGDYSAPVRRPGDPEDHDWPAMAGFRVVSPQYFGVLRQPVLRGRGLTDADREGAAPVAVVTPGIAARLWPGEDPIGKTVTSNFVGDRWMTVVGVVAEASSWRLPRGAQNEIYVPLAQHPREGRFQLVAVVRAASDPATVSGEVRARLRAAAPELPARLGTLEERIAESASGRRFVMAALTIFAGVALLLAAVGVYGVMSYTVATRAREIGVRLALGATPGLVRREVLAAAAAMAAAGIAAGALGGVFATRWLESALYGVTRLDPVAYAVGGAVLLLAALGGAYVPARRSSRVDPMLAIRTE